MMGMGGGMKSGGHAGHGGKHAGHGSKKLNLLALLQAIRGQPQAGGTVGGGMPMSMGGGMGGMRGM